MTTTDCYTGVGDGQKNSSRVLRPPGGGSSDIFGSGSVGHTKSAAEEQKQNSAKAAAGSNIFGGPLDNTEDATSVKHINRKAQPSSQSTIFGGTPSANASDLKKRDKEGTYNPITGELIGAKDDTPQRNSSRVINPPGGKSTGLW
ncbi:unnamed protein product [Mytilus coruscus]|uniref:Microtubule-associated protein Jupiter n=1 Tax=Mytilus coruscus TaxID=42192 RepID=A0A6J7ZX75_MYTCO|nr:unnamed protein product [Mytilus coruscus]